jgi:hypothetical protein
MPTPATENPRAWRAETIDAPDTWYYRLSDRALSSLDRIVQGGRRSQPVTDLEVTADLRSACAEEMGRVQTALEAGRGFAIVTAGEPGRFSPDDLQAVYWLVGQLLGRPVEQNVQGTLLYDVRDTGQDVRYGARFSVTNAESTFHTDNSFGTEVVDYVGLLCLNPSKSGGLSQVVSGQAVQEVQMAKHPDVLEILARPFHVDRRGGLRPGDESTVRFPVLAGDGPGLLVRYLRYWIEAGHEKAGQPLTAEQVRALDVLDRVAGAPEMRVEFALKPGAMFFVNNRWILHNRTAFEDYTETERRRHYVRLWLQRTTPAGSPH